MSLILSFKVGKCHVGNRTAKDVLRCLADYADDNGEKCFPGRATIVKETEINKNSFAAAIGFLESNGWLKINRHQKANSNSYELNVAKIFSESQTTESQIVVLKSGQPKTSTTVVPKTGQPKNGSTKNPYNSSPKTSTTVVPKSGQDPVMIQSINSHIHNMSSEQNSDAGEEEHFALTSPEEDTPKPQDPIVKIANRCPIKKIIDIYHETLPMGTPVRTWKSAKRIKIMKARWEELVEDEKCESEEAALSILRDFFINAIASSNFLTGKIAPRNPNDAPFQISLEWILTEGNWDKIVDGHYVNRKKNTPQNNSYPPRGY